MPEMESVPSPETAWTWRVVRSATSRIQQLPPRVARRTARPGKNDVHIEGSPASSPLWSRRYERTRHSRHSTAFVCTDHALSPDYGSVGMSGHGTGGVRWRPCARIICFLPLETVERSSGDPDRGRHGPAHPEELARAPAYSTYHHGWRLRAGMRSSMRGVCSWSVRILCPSMAGWRRGLHGACAHHN